MVIKLQGVPDLEQLKESLLSKINSSKDFFTGASVLFEDNIGLPETGKKELENICRKHGLEPCGQYIQEVSEELPIISGLLAEELNDDCLLIEYTVRSGQRISSKGHLVILGDVNPGAFVEADGHILVLGTLRGTAHAGINGDTKARIIAHRLKPTLLRITNLIARAPENDMNLELPERAYIDDGRIVVAPNAKVQQANLAG